MPKPNVSSKDKSIDSQATGARASTIDSCGPVSDSSTKLDMPLDKTYDMCKELYKEVSESVLHCINERFEVSVTCSLTGGTAILCG